VCVCVCMCVCVCVCVWVCVWVCVGVCVQESEPACVDPGAAECLGCQMDLLVGEMFCGDPSPFAPHHFLYAAWRSPSTVRLAGYTQQGARAGLPARPAVAGAAVLWACCADAHDFFMAVLDGLHHSIGRQPAAPGPGPGLSLPCVCVVRSRGQRRAARWRRPRPSGGPTLASRPEWVRPASAWCTRCSAPRCAPM
jgi:hypothetical protein